MNKAKFLFGDIVVVDKENIGVIVKSWYSHKFNSFHYMVYVRIENAICHYYEDEIERYRVRHKYLSEEDLEYQNN